MLSLLSGLRPAMMAETALSGAVEGNLGPRKGGPPGYVKLCRIWDNVCGDWSAGGE